MALMAVEVSWIAGVELVLRAVEAVEKVVRVVAVSLAAVAGQVWRAAVAEISMAVAELLMAVAGQIVVVERVSTVAEVEQDSIAEWVVIVGVEQILRAAVTEISWAAELVSIAAGVELVAVVEVSQIVEQISIAETRTTAARTEHIRNAEQTAEHDQAVVAARSLHSPFEAIATTATTATRTTAERERVAVDAGNTHSDPTTSKHPTFPTAFAIKRPLPSNPGLSNDSSGGSTCTGWTRSFTGTDRTFC